MARIASIPEKSGGLLTRALTRGARKNVGRHLEPIGVTAHAPGLLLGYSLFELTTQKAHAAPQRLKHLATIRSAQLIGCEFCVDIGSHEAREAGITDDQLRALSGWRESDLFDETDRQVLELADGMTRTPVEVGDELIAALNAKLGERALVELVSVLGLENYRARFNWAFDIGAAGFSEGMYCVPPVPAEASAAAA